MTSLAFKAMTFAREAHARQRRKFTGNPYTDHLAEVAGIVVTVDARDHVIATAWLHDVVEDTPVTCSTIGEIFGSDVYLGVKCLTNPPGKTLQETLDRLHNAPDWVQSIKVADIISNMSSVRRHDPLWAKTYGMRKIQTLDVLTKAHPSLMKIARHVVRGACR